MISLAPIFRKQLTEEEKNCNEKWVKGHRCKAKLLMLSVDGSCIIEYTHSERDAETEEECPLENMIVRGEQNLTSLHELQRVYTP